MEGPFYSRRSYMYGKTFFEEEVPFYNSIKHHALPPRARDFTKAVPYDDGIEYREDGSESRGQLIRGSIPNIINVASCIVKTLKLMFYGVTEEDDFEQTMEIGKRYAVTYITQYGLKFADGYLRYISNSIPDEHTLYTGEYNSANTQGYIGIDCSAKGVSDKRKIYVATIRKVEELPDDADYVAPIENDDVKMLKIIENINNILEEIEEHGAECCSTVQEKLEYVKNRVDDLKENNFYYDEISEEEAQGGIYYDIIEDENGNGIYFDEIDPEEITNNNADGPVDDDF